MASNLASTVTSNVGNTMRKAVTHVTDFMFPKGDADVQYYTRVPQTTEYVSSLPLQMSLYFNMFFFPAWIVVESVMLEAKWSKLNSIYQIILAALIVVMTIIEIIRLYLGYIGNIGEKVPELAGSWLLTLLLQFPFALFMLLNGETIILPIERAMHIVFTIFVVAEVILGFFAIRTMTKLQMTKFHMQQFAEADINSRDDAETLGAMGDGYTLLQKNK